MATSGFEHKNTPVNRTIPSVITEEDIALLAEEALPNSVAPSRRENIDGTPFNPLDSSQLAALDSFLDRM